MSENLLYRAMDFFGSRKTATASRTFTPVDAELSRILSSGATSSGKAVNEQTALSLATAWSCMRIITEAIGCLPWGIYQKDASGNAVEKDHPLSAVLMGSPNQDQTPVEFKESIALALCGAGNAYNLKSALGNEVVSLMPVQSSAMSVFRKRGSNTTLAVPDGTAVFRMKQEGGVTKDYTRADIWQIKGFGGNPLVGLSPVGVVREAVGFALAAEDFGARFFSQGGRPGGIVSVAGWLNDNQRSIARENLQQAMAGLDNAHRFLLFEGGMKPEPWGDLSLEDMAYIAVRKFSVNEMCRIWRVPPHMVAELQGGASFASVEQLSQEFVMFTLLPYLTRIESSVKRWLFNEQDRQRWFLRFRYEGLLRADSAARANFYASALQNGYMTRNEVRALENLNRVDGLDEYTAQLNLAPVEMLGELAQKNGGKSTTTPPAEAPKGFVEILRAIRQKQ